MGLQLENGHLTSATMFVPFSLQRLFSHDVIIQYFPNQSLIESIDHVELIH